MFTTKQSDYWYVVDTNEVLVCNISSVSAQGTPCRGELHANYPIIHSINLDTNAKKLLYPTDETGQLTESLSAGYVYSFVPTCSADINISEISKPQISFNDYTGLYTITFLGYYGDNSASIFAYYFQYANNLMHPVSTFAYLPESKLYNYKYTFDNGNINATYHVGGISVYSDESFFATKSNYRAPNYSIHPFNYQTSLLFGAGIWNDDIYPYSFSGSFITHKKDELSFDTSENISVLFSCKVYSLSSQKALVSVANRSLSASRNIRVGDVSASDYYGDGFSVIFYEPGDNDLELNGIGSTFGYVPASSATLEFDAPVTYNTLGIKQNGYLAVGFDISGDFCTTVDGKISSYDKVTGHSNVKNSIGIRGNKGGVLDEYNNIWNKYTVLSQSSAVTAIDFHEVVDSYSTAAIKDYRVDLVNNSSLVRVYGKLRSETDYQLLHSLDISNLQGYNKLTPGKLKAAISFSTSLKATNFALERFQVVGVRK
jgi:hypothetical protein